MLDNDYLMIPTKTATVANYFIRKGRDNGDPVTLMKLQKLIYFAHGWFLGFYKKELIPDKIEAWKFGPVIKSLYDTSKIYGIDPIKKIIPIDEVGLEDNEIKVLDFTWKTYAHLDGLKLSAITHEKGSPWYISYFEKGGKDMLSFKISNDLIQEYFEKLLNEYRAAKTRQ